MLVNISTAHRDRVSSWAATLPGSLGETSHRTIRRQKMAWNWLADGLLFQPPSGKQAHVFCGGWQTNNDGALMPPTGLEVWTEDCQGLLR
ncbi:hypothetical protein CHARACLAT_017113 [Characodon lateralis]|uniref:Uncharacterized protein n=1 Tax=Characodon lateralis TaxID=208331 RepID=A0ABU7EAD5_9TELE|nr:hypothetical protein [Characodon lateralis]